MREINNYVWSLIVIAVCVGVCLMVSHEDRQSGKLVRFIGALCITSFMLAPLTDILGDMDISFEIPAADGGISEGEGISDLIISETKRRIAEDAEEYVMSKYGISCEIVSVDIRTSENNAISLNGLYAVLDTKSKFIAAEIKERLGNIYGCRVAAELRPG